MLQKKMWNKVICPAELMREAGKVEKSTSKKADHELSKKEYHLDMLITSDKAFIDQETLDSKTSREPIINSEV